MLRYRAYSCLIESELEFPEFLIGTSSATEPFTRSITIRYGAVPAELDNPTGQGVLYQATDDQFLLKIDGVARYLVCNGHEIVVEPAAGSRESDVRVFLLGSCFGALLHQRDMLVLHASAIGNAQGAFLFVGASGMGKSTLLGELLRRGHRMLVDDLCAVTLDGSGYPMVVPAYPRVQLWADAASKLDHHLSALPRTRPALEKYEIQVADQFWDRAAPLRRIYQLESTNKDELQLQHLPFIHRFGVVLSNTYRRVLLDGLAMRPSHYRLISAVINSVGITTVARPEGSFKLAALAELIERDWETA